MNEIQFEFLDELKDSEIKDILRNLNNIFRLSEGTVPLLRGLGLSIDNVSKIAVDLENDIVTDMVAKVESFEPRVSVSSVDFFHDQDGKTKIKVYLEKGTENGEY